MNQSAQLEVDAIRGIVSGIVGMNHCLLGTVSHSAHSLGVRTVEIIIQHEIPCNENTEKRIKEELSSSVTLIIEKMISLGYSITATDDVVCMAESYNRLTIPLRSSLKPTSVPAKVEEQPPAGVSVNVLSPM